MVLNFDETCVQSPKKSTKVIISSESEKGYVPGLEVNLKFTLGVSICANGTLPTPMVVLGGKTLPELPQHLCESAKYYCQETVNSR